MKPLIILLCSLISVVGAVTPDLNVGHLGLYGPLDHKTDVFSSAVSTNITIPIDGTSFKVLNIDAEVTVTFETHGLGALTPATARTWELFVVNASTNLITWAVDEGTLTWLSTPIAKAISHFEFLAYGGNVYGRQVGGVNLTIVPPPPEEENVTITNLWINPTDGHVPYRASATNFLNSPWYRDSDSQVTLKPPGGSGILTLYSSTSIGHVDAAANRSLFLGAPTAGYDIRFTIAGTEQWEIDTDGNFLSTQSGINNIGLDNNGTFNGPAKIFASNNLGIRNAHTPANSAETNVIGAICFDASYLYIWTDTNVNKRIAWGTW